MDSRGGGVERTVPIGNTVRRAWRFQPGGWLTGKIIDEGLASARGGISITRSHMNSGIETVKEAFEEFRARSEGEGEPPVPAPSSESIEDALYRIISPDPSN